MVFIANLPYCQQFRITACRIAGSVGQKWPFEKKNQLALLPYCQQFSK
jgi:hypothetical protein